MDVDKAVAAAKDAFENGEWGRMNARDRGRLMYRYDFFLKYESEDFPGGPVAKIPRSQGRGPRFDPWSGN